MAASSPSATACAPHHSCHIAAVALGTRGDVQPVALVLAQLSALLQQQQQQQSPITTNVALITHAVHEPWLQQLLQCAAARTRPQLRLVSSLPGRQWQGAASATDEVSALHGAARTRPA